MTSAIKSPILLAVFFPCLVLSLVLGVTLHLIPPEASPLFKNCLGACTAGAVLITLSALWVAARMRADLNSIFQRLLAVGRMVIQASLTVSDLSETSLLEGMRTTESIGETRSAVAGVSELMVKNAENSKRASAVTVECSGVSQQASQEISKLTVVMQSLSRRSGEIQAITSVIEDIAFQTNLLALNAAVEAARAGEQGKGFAVVADAVRGLAQKSSEAAKNISVLISASTDEIKLVSATAQSSELIFKQVSREIETVAKLNHEIATASHSQLDDMNRVSQSIRPFNTEAIVEVARCAASLSNEADSLEGVLLDFSRFTSNKKTEDPHNSLVALKAALATKGPLRLNGEVNFCGRDIPNLEFGHARLAGQFEILDHIKKEFGGTATLFVKSNSDFIRVSTNILKPNGGRALGTSLANGSALQALSSGRSFAGEVEILNAKYNAYYEPMLHQGRVVGAYYFGYKKRG